VDCNPLIVFQASLCDQCSVGGNETATQTCGADEVDLIGQSDQIGVGIFD
jgi:hypothetical protein